MNSLGAVYDTTIAALRDQAATLARLQEQGSSGQKLIRASDSPADAYQVMNLQAQQQSLDTYSGNIDRISTDLNQGSTILQDMSGSLTRVKTLLTQAASGTYTDKDRQPIAAEIDSVLETMVSQANTQNVGRYIFGGGNQASPPYQVTRVNGQITAVAYKGSMQNLSVPVAPGIDHGGSLVGESIFRSNQRQAPVFLGNTGANVGTGTSGVQGDAHLSIIHTATTFSGATGLLAGASSADGDTIIGSHTVTIDATAKTVKLDDGQAVAYTAADANLKVTNAAGDVAYLDVTDLSSGLAGTTTVAVTSGGKLSLDDGATTTAINFSANQSVVDSRTGRNLFVDTTGITRTGVEAVSVPGTYDLFATLINARDVLLKSDSGPSGAAAATAQIQGALDSVTQVAKAVAIKAGAVGAQLSALDGLKSSLGNMNDDAKSRASELADVDVAQLATELARAQTFYQMTLMSTAKVMNLSLLDYLPATA